jgi:hypothetical protein
VWSKDPESYAGGSLATGRASLAGQVDGDHPDEERQPPTPRCLCVACLNPCQRGEWHMGDVSLTEPLGNRVTFQSMCLALA